LWGFRVSGVRVIFGMTVMARWTGRRDRGVRGIPGAVDDSGAGWQVVATARVRAVPAGFAARAPRVREGKDDRGFEGVIELSGKVFENTRDLAGDLIGAKNVGVTDPARDRQAIRFLGSVFTRLLAPVRLLPLR
jgi:hypothetical protein